MDEPTAGLDPNQIREVRNLIRDYLHKGENLLAVLKAGGAIIFPHFNIRQCGSHYAATVHACMNSGAHTVLGVGVLHARFDELQTARVRVAKGGPTTNVAC